MQFTCEVIINRPIDQVIELFDDPNNLKQWMDGLTDFIHVSGIPGQPGAQSRLIFKMGNRDMELIETITERNLPHEFSGTYEANGVTNEVRNRFESLPGGKTKYTTENFFEFKGFMKIIAFLMPGAFKKQSLKYMINFKNFTETHNNNLNIKQQANGTG